MNVPLSLAKKTRFDELVTSMRLESYLGRNINKGSKVRDGQRGKKECDIEQTVTLLQL